MICKHFLLFCSLRFHVFSWDPHGAKASKFYEVQIANIFLFWTVVFVSSKKTLFSPEFQWFSPFFSLKLYSFPFTYVIHVAIICMKCEALVWVQLLLVDIQLVCPPCFSLERLSLICWMLFGISAKGNLGMCVSLFLSSLFIPLIHVLIVCSFSNIVECWLLQVYEKIWYWVG